MNLLQLPEDREEATRWLIPPSGEMVQMRTFWSAMEFKEVGVYSEGTF